MTTNEVAQAAELREAAIELGNHAWLARFRVANYQNKYNELSPDACRDIAGYVDKFLKQVLALVPADSDEPITQGFLMDVGFQLTESSSSVVIWKLGELWLVCTALGNEWKWNGHLIESWPKTRRDVRLLAAALGITLESGGK